MEQDVIRINRWNMAGKYGLVFGLISVAYLYYGHLTVVLGMTGFVSSALGFIIWAAKFVGCIKLMKYCMNRFAIDNPSATNSDTFKLGVLIAMFSAVVFSVVTVADHLYIFPEYYQSLYGAMLKEWSQLLPADRIAEMKDMFADAHKIAFVGTFIYCFLFGTVLSLILSRNIPSKDPFHNYKPDEQ